MATLEELLVEAANKPTTDRRVKKWLLKLANGDFVRWHNNVRVGASEDKETGLWVIEIANISDPTATGGRRRTFATRNEALRHVDYLIKLANTKVGKLQVDEQVKLELELLRTKEKLSHSRIW